MKLGSLAVFGVGYVLGARAGKQRYEQMARRFRNTVQRLEDLNGAVAEYDPASEYNSPSEYTVDEWPRAGEQAPGTAYDLTTEYVVRDSRYA